MRQPSGGDAAFRVVEMFAGEASGEAKFPGAIWDVDLWLPADLDGENPSRPSTSRSSVLWAGCTCDLGLWLVADGLCKAVLALLAAPPQRGAEFGSIR